MIQILSLREYFNTKTQKYETTDKLLGVAPSIPELIRNPEKYFEGIDPKERFNLHYTVADCTEEKRQFHKQDIIPFDIDYIDVNTSHPSQKFDPRYIEIVCDILKVPKEKLGIIFSGHGLHFLVQLTSPFISAEYFATHRPHYRLICEKIDGALKSEKLSGTADRLVFGLRRMMRLPGTINRKRDKADVYAYTIIKSIEPVDFDLVSLSGLPLLRETDTLSLEEKRKYPKPDAPTIMAGCDFLKWASEKQAEVREPAWYAALSIVGAFENGVEAAHEISKNHPKYSPSETDSKLKHAVEFGPRTCANIETLWNKCHTCPNFGKITSPIQLRSADYIKTKDRGFRIREDKDGKPAKKARVCYEDLKKLYDQKYHPRTHKESGQTFVWTGSHYVAFSAAEIKSFVHDHVANPSSFKSERAEFLDLVHSTNLFSEADTRGYMNFKNGVLNTKTRILEPHDPKFGFQHVLPYDYNPLAEAPNFKKFIDEITSGDESKQKVLLEAAGYALSDQPYWRQEAILLQGDGRNGKSTFLNILKELAGHGNYSSASISQFRNEFHLQLLDGKLFNISEELPADRKINDDLLKLLTGDGNVSVSQKYKNSYSFKNRAKLLFSCNELPETRDTSKGFYSRFLIIPFTADFSVESGRQDPFLFEKLKEELSGIFNLVLEALLRLETTGNYTKSAAITEAINDYRKASDFVGTWVEEDLEISTDYAVGTSLQEIYQSYENRAKCEGEEEILSRRKLLKRVRVILPNYKEREKEGRKTSARGLAGIRLRSKPRF